MNFSSEEFKQSATQIGRIVRIAATQGHDRSGIIERDHVYLRLVYDKLKIDLPTLSHEARPSMRP